MELTRLMGRATVGAVGVAMAVLLLPSAWARRHPSPANGAAGAATPPAPRSVRPTPLPRR